MHWPNPSKNQKNMNAQSMSRTAIYARTVKNMLSSVKNAVLTAVAPRQSILEDE